MQAIDQYMLRQTVTVAEQVQRWYAEFAFHKIYQEVNRFCIVELSAFYFDILKDRLYTAAPASRARRSAQTAIWRIGEALVRLLAPVMSFTSDEVWQYLPKLPGRPESVHLAQFAAAADLLGPGTALDDPSQREDWTTLRAVRDDVLKALEEARNSKLIGGGLEAQVSIRAPESVYSVLARYHDQLRYLFIVSAVALELSPAGNGTGGVSVQVSKAAGQKCERCWNYSTRVGEDARYPTVCERCSAVLKEIVAEERAS
jgi:isoleucyl-tRNA synthetase